MLSVSYIYSIALLHIQRYSDLRLKRETTRKVACLMSREFSDIQTQLQRQEEPVGSPPNKDVERLVGGRSRFTSHTRPVRDSFSIEDTFSF